MKKNYMKPAACQMEFFSEGTVANIKVVSDASTPVSEYWTRENGYGSWSSEQWDGSDISDEK